MIAMKRFLVVGMLVLGAGTAQATSQPRKTNSGLAEKWAHPVTVVLDPSLEDLADGASNEVQSALRTWLADVASLPNVVFEAGTERTVAAFDGKSVVLAGPITTPGFEAALALTTTYASDATGDILEADIVFNTKYSFAVMAKPPAMCAHVFDVGAVATHEAGHFFGLGEDYEETTTTMYVTTDPCDAHKRTLTPEDTIALSGLYAPSMTAAQSTHCNAGPARPADASFGLALLSLALAVATRRMGRDDARRCHRTRPRR